MKTAKIGTYNYQPGESISDFAGTKPRKGLPEEMSASAKRIVDAYAGRTDVVMVYHESSNTITFTGYCMSGKIKLE
jgi:hypothetical protein